MPPVHDSCRPLVQSFILLSFHHLFRMTHWKKSGASGGNCGTRSIFSSSFFIFIPRKARSSLFALRTSCFPLRSSGVTLCAEWLMLCDTLQLWTCPNAQQGPRVIAAATVQDFLWSFRPLVALRSCFSMNGSLVCLSHECTMQVSNAYTIPLIYRWLLFAKLCCKGREEDCKL